MSGPEQRLVLFEVSGSAYALPIAEILEVAEVARIWAVPTLSRRIVGIANHHGDALPVIARQALFGDAEWPTRDPQQVLVVGAPGREAGRVGVPIDRVLGLVDGAPPAPQGEDPVIERRSIRGRVVAFLDVRRLLEQAVRAIGSAPAATETNQGGKG